MTLRDALESPELQKATLSALLGPAGARSVRMNGSELSVPAYLRLISRLCNEAAAAGEEEISAPELEQLFTTGSAVKLSGSVGPKGANHVDDVKLVQHLLNFNFPPATLQENGTVDADTIAAIQNYQRDILGDKRPDGRVDPGGQTFRSLMANKLAFFRHCCKPSASAATVAVDATSMNPGFMTATGVTRNKALQDIVGKRVLGNARFKKLRFALVDLTGSSKLANPQFAGNRELEQGGMGSIGKLACLYVAWQLKFDLEELSHQRGITDEAALFAAARSLWDSTQKPDPAHVTQLFPAIPKIELNGKLVLIDGKPVPGPAALSAPELEKMFTATPDGTGGLFVRFKGSDVIFVDPAAPGHPPNATAKVTDYAAHDEDDLAAIRKLSFAEQLFLMIDDSDNAAARSCSELVSYLYMTSAVWQADLYSPKRGGGIWESGHGGPWILPPVPQKKDNPESDFISATAASIASLLTLMEQGRLVNGDASAGMKHLMNKNKPGVKLGPTFAEGSFTKSYFLMGLRKILDADSELVRIHSKLGIGNKLSGHRETIRDDCAIVVRRVPDPAHPGSSKEFTYVAAAFDDPAKDGPDLQALIVELDKCIRENNGLLAASAP